MFKPIIRLLSFFTKEVNEVRRQPRLVLSLLLGPFLILMLFGVGYRGGQPQLRTALVLPPANSSELNIDALKQLGGLNFNVVSVGDNREEALELLERGELEVVQIFPQDVEERVLHGEQTAVEFKYNEINPLNEQWIQYLAYAQVVEMNRTILLQAVNEMQAEAARTNSELTDVREQLDAAETSLETTDRERLRAAITRLRQASAALAASALVVRSGNATPESEQTRNELLQLQQDLETLDAALATGSLEEQRERIRVTRARVVRLEELTGTLAELPPEVIVSPLEPRAENLNGTSYELMIFYAPGVLALLLQHIAVTLGALSLVRERLLGATEFFRVAPVTVSQLLLGKYLGYTLFIVFIAALLMGAMLLLGIPFLGSVISFVLLGLLLTVAALGVGFFISALSSSDSQAIQLSMLVLLLSIFFGGFFLPLQNFWEPLRVVGYILPLTHGIAGFQAILLRGVEPGAFIWGSLGLIAALTFGGSLLLTWLQFRRP